MLKRSLVVPALAVAGVSALASLGVVVESPAAHGVLNVDVCVKGTQRFQSGSAACLADPGNTAVAVGPSAQSTADIGTHNTATAVGAGALAGAGDGNNNTATSVHSTSNSAALTGNNNRATAIGPVGGADASGGNNNTAIGVRCLAPKPTGSNDVTHCP